MIDTTTPPAGSSRPAGSRRKTALIVTAVVAGALLFAGLTAWLVSAVGDDGNDTKATNAAFVSAMKKAGVDARPPLRPVPIDQVSAQGTHRFSATFTQDEVSALIAAFPYRTTVDGSAVSITDPRLTITAPDLIELEASLGLGSNVYSGSMEAPVAFEDGRITSPGLTDLRVEGLPVDGARKDQASTAVFDYLNDYLAAAPGLTVTGARVVDGGLVVEGTAPDSLSY